MVIRCDLGGGGKMLLYSGGRRGFSKNWRTTFFCGSSNARAGLAPFGLAPWHLGTELVVNRSSNCNRASQAALIHSFTRSRPKVSYLPTWRASFSMPTTGKTYLSQISSTNYCKFRLSYAAQTAISIALSSHHHNHYLISNLLMCHIPHHDT